MGLVSHIWDDTVGGPRPGKLRQLDVPPAAMPSRSDSLASDSMDSPMAQSPPSEFAKSMLDRRNSAEFQKRQDEAKKVTQSISIAKQSSMDRTSSLPSSFSGSPGSTGVVSPSTRREDNIWRSVFHPGSNKAGMDTIGGSKFDKPDKSSDAKAPSVYDWMYHPGSKHNYR